MDNDAGRKHEPLPLKDWLWRLDRIQEELGRLLPERDLYVLLSLSSKPDAGRGVTEFRTFHFGRVIDGKKYLFPVVYIEPEFETWWLDFHNPGFEPFIIRCGNGLDCWSLEDRMPDGYLRRGEDCPKGVLRARWSIWYYTKTQETPDRERLYAAFGRYCEIEGAILEACAVAPAVVYERLGGRDPSALCCWPTTLFYMALCRSHPLLTCWIDRAGWGGAKKDLDGSWAFANANDYLIELTPDIRTATEYGLDVLRNLAKVEEDSTSRKTGSEGERRIEEGPYVFKNKGATWQIIYEGHETTVKDSKGIRYIHYLVKNPNRAIECLDIEQACSGTPDREKERMTAAEAMDSGLSSDTFDPRELDKHEVDDLEKVKDTLQRKIERADDPRRKAEYQEQFDALDTYLAKRLNIHGEGRPTGDFECARKRVSNRINDAKRRLMKYSEHIGTHIGDAVKASETTFVYKPDRQIDWTLE